MLFFTSLLCLLGLPYVLVELVTWIFCLTWNTWYYNFCHLFLWWYDGSNLLPSLLHSRCALLLCHRWHMNKFFNFKIRRRIYSHCLLWSVTCDFDYFCMHLLFFSLFFFIYCFLVCFFHLYTVFQSCALLLSSVCFFTI